MPLLHKPKRIEKGNYLVQVMWLGDFGGLDYFRLRLGRVRKYDTGYVCDALAEKFYNPSSYSGHGFERRSGWFRATPESVLGCVRGELESESYAYNKLLKQVIKTYPHIIEEME